MSLSWKPVMLVGGCLTGVLLVSNQAAIAAETVVLTYGFTAMEIPVADLEAFAENGETSEDLEQLLNIAGQDPETLRSSLNETIPLNLIVLDLALNSPPGEWVLDQVSDTIQPASGEAGRLAMRSALIGAAADDNEITLLEVMQVYPTPEIVVKGDRLIETYSRLYDVLEPLQDLAEVLQQTIEQ